MNEQQKKVLETLKQKKTEFEYELAITSNPSLKFELKQRIEQCEQELERLNNVYEAEKQRSNIFDQECDQIDLEQQTDENIDVSPDEWFRRSTKSQSRLSKFFKSIFEDK